MIETVATGFYSKLLRNRKLQTEKGGRPEGEKGKKDLSGGELNPGLERDKLAY